LTKPIVTYATALHAQNQCSKLEAVARLPNYQAAALIVRGAGTYAEIYQTSYENGIAFLVKIVGRSKKKLINSSNFEKEPSHGGGRRFESGRAHRSFCNRPY
jgi:hypothetical protein